MAALASTKVAGGHSNPNQAGGNPTMSICQEETYYEKTAGAVDAIDGHGYEVNSDI